MSGGKETPRQKMIGMMYLVLTALLALNVSDQVLHAFKIVRDGLEVTNTAFESKNQIQYKAFDKALKDFPGKTKPFYDKAMVAKKLCGELDKYILELKTEMITKGGNIDPETGDILNNKDLDVSAEMMITEKKGEALKKKILDTRASLMNLVDAKDRATFVLGLNPQDPKGNVDHGSQTWESEQFEGVPLTAAVTLMSKLQNEVHNAESDVVTYLLKSIDATDFKFDQLNAVAVASSSYVLQGQPYKAEVFLTASDSRQDPEVYVGGGRLPTEDGKGTYTGNTSSEGIKTWFGIIKVKNPATGEVTEYKTPEQTYQVAKPTAVVAADKMNVFYIGVDNPVSISAPGIPKERIRPSISNGTITGSNGAYIVRVTNQGEANVTVNGEVEKGKNAILGSAKYRVKIVPSPIAKFGGLTSGAMNKGTATAQGFVSAVMDNFDFDVKFNVNKFKMIVVKKGQDTKILDAASNALTGEMIAAIKTLNPGDRFLIDDIQAKGPDGTNRKLGVVAISIQ